MSIVAINIQTTQSGQCYRKCPMFNHDRSLLSWFVPEWRRYSMTDTIFESVFIESIGLNRDAFGPRYMGKWHN